MNIIEKLGMKTPEELHLVGDIVKLYEVAGWEQPTIYDEYTFNQAQKLKEILDSRNEMLEALIEDCIAFANDTFTYCDYYRNRSIIEKETGLTWDEIKKGELDES